MMARFFGVLSFFDIYRQNMVQYIISLAIDGKVIRKRIPCHSWQIDDKIYFRVLDTAWRRK